MSICYCPAVHVNSLHLIVQKYCAYIMNTLNIFNTIVKLLSTVAFIFTLNFLIVQLLNPPLADVSGKLFLSNIDPIPLITICPFNQINGSKLKYLGYDKTSYFLKGVKDIDGEQHLTWGSDINKTFEELLEFVVDISTENYSGLHVN